MGRVPSIRGTTTLWVPETSSAQVGAVAADNGRSRHDPVSRGLWLVPPRRPRCCGMMAAVLLRLVYLSVTGVFGLLRLLPVSDRDKDAGIVVLQAADAVMSPAQRPTPGLPG